MERLNRTVVTQQQVNNFSLRYSLLVFILVIIVLLSACTKLDKTVIRFGLSSVVQKFDPRYSTDATSTRVIRLIYRQLVDFDENIRPTQDLASWKKINPLHYRFYLGKKGRRFHDGSRLEAKDVKATYYSVLGYSLSTDKVKVAQQAASPHRQSVELIKSIKVIDPDTIDFILSRADPAFPGYLVIGIMPERLIISGHDFNSKPVGSGPFEFVSRPEQDLFTLVRIRDKQKFTFIHVNNSTTRVLKLLRGEIDIVQNNLPLELTEYLGKHKNIRILFRQGTNFSYMGFNLKDNHLKDRRVRLAIAHAINRTRIVKKMYGKKTRLAAAIFTPDHWAGHPTLKSWPYDPKRARELLQQAGYGPENPLKLTYKTTNNPFRVRIATILQHQLGQVGIKVNLRTYEWTTFYNDIKRGNFQIYTLEWVAVKSPDIFRHVYHSGSIPGKVFIDPIDKTSGFIDQAIQALSLDSSLIFKQKTDRILKLFHKMYKTRENQGANRNRFRDKVIDAYIENAEKSYDHKNRVKLYRKIHEILLDRLPIIPLWYDQHMAAMHRYIKGYKISYDGSFDTLNTVYTERE